MGGTLDLGMGDEADAEMRRLEEERRRRRAAEGLETAPPGQDDLAPQREATRLRAEAGYDDAALDRALRGLQVPAPQGHRMTTSPTFTPEERERIGGVEARLQAGDRRGVERDAIRDMQGAQPMRQEAVTAAEPVPMQQAAQGTGSDPGMAVQQTAAPPAAPRRDTSMRALSEMRPDPRANPVAGALKTTVARDAERDGEQNAAALEERWTRRINEVETMMRQARDQRTRAVLGSLLMNLVRGAAHALAGTSPSTGPIRPDLDAFERRARERLSDRTREWGASDDMLLRAQEMRDARRERMGEAAQQADRREIERGELDLARIREERTSRIADARQRLAEAQSEQERSAAMLELQRNDPASAESERARRRYVAEAMARERALGASGRSALEVEAEVRDMSAVDIEAMEGELASMTVGTRTSRAGGGGGTPRDGLPRAERRAQLLEAGRAAGMNDAQMASMDDDDIARELSLRQRSTAEVQGARRQMLPGVTVDANLVDDVTARNHRAGLIEGRRAGDSLRTIRSVAQRYGAGAVIDPRAHAEMSAAVQRLLARVAAMRNSGVIQPSELPTIESFIPNPSSGQQVTFNTVLARVDAFMADVESDVRATLEADGAAEGDIEAALRYVRGGGGGGAQPRQTAPSATTGGRQFRVTSPDGRTITRPLTPEQERTFRASRGYRVEEVR